MKVLKIVLPVLLVMGFNLTASAGSLNSAHLCQVIGKSEQVAYHTAGSLIALQNNVRVSCPITSPFLRDNLNVRVYFNTLQVRVTGANYITCHVNKTTSDSHGFQGSPRGAGIPVINQLNISNNQRLPKLIGANVVCLLQKGAKIIGYQLM